MIKKTQLPKLKESIKYILGFILVALIPILCFLIYLQVDSSVKYEIDEANSCSWTNGRITSSTIINAPSSEVEVKKSNEKAFLQNAANNSKCVQRK